ncbi:zinc-ribbon domain-containing protein [Fundidesulfovibrio putealis]|uniref:zinc-ribbon domain-containing protein n=1 Tax=Fundidesulfovibrio putealis TaxID=270496 RepID=UPI000410DDA2|nr:zinc ribbon domain-containing protein [Fundidesulfovibrio putealis]
MICNKCGQENQDDALSCGSCGHKLQSSQSGPGQLGFDDGGYVEPIPMLHEAGPATRRKTRKHVEAWAVALLAGGAAYGLSAAELYWPLFVLAGAAMAYALLRGLNWKG